MAVPLGQKRYRWYWIVLVSDAIVYAKLRCLFHGIFDKGLVPKPRGTKGGLWSGISP
jgi:hypothetical protein